MPYTDSAKELAVSLATEHNADHVAVAAALNSIMTPDGYHDGSGPKEGDTKTINGVTYVLRGGKWHKQQAKTKQPKQTKAEALAAAVEAIPVTRRAEKLLPTSWWLRMLLRSA